MAKSGVIDFEKWYRESHERNTPWGDEDREPVLTQAESSLERQLSRDIMADKPKPKTFKAGETLVEQGSSGRDIFLVLDGMLDVVVDGEIVGEVGPGAIVGERAWLEQGTRTATLTARTRARVVTFGGDDLDPADLSEISAGHRRSPEDPASTLGSWTSRLARSTRGRSPTRRRGR